MYDYVVFKCSSSSSSNGNGSDGSGSDGTELLYPNTNYNGGSDDNGNTNNELNHTLEVGKGKWCSVV